MRLWEYFYAKERGIETRVYSESLQPVTRIDIYIYAGTFETQRNYYYSLNMLTLLFYLRRWINDDLFYVRKFTKTNNYTV